MFEEGFNNPGEYYLCGFALPSLNTMLVPLLALRNKDPAKSTDVADWVVIR